MSLKMQIRQFIRTKLVTGRIRTLVLPLLAGLWNIPFVQGGRIQA